MKSRVAWCLLAGLSLLHSCSSATSSGSAKAELVKAELVKAELAKADHILLITLSATPVPGLEWLSPAHDHLPLPHLQQLRRQALWIEPAAAGLVELPELAAAAQETGLIPAFFGEIPSVRPAHSWSLGDPQPRCTVPPSILAKQPPITLAEQRPGMTAPIRIVMTRPYSLQLADCAAQFFRQMALDERSWCACFTPGDWVAGAAQDPATLARARDHLPAHAQPLAAWMLQDDALGLMLADLVTIEQMRRTLVIVRAATPDSPLLVWWPGIIQGGSRHHSDWTSQRIMGELCRLAAVPPIQRQPLALDQLGVRP